MSNNNSHPDSHRSLIKSSSIIAAGTLSSRILGFVRDMILAKLFGTGWRADAFFVALRIPNLFRDLVGEGASNSAVVPILSEYLVRKERKEYWHLVSVILIWALMILSALTTAGMFFAPVIVRLIAPGFMAEPEKLALTIQLTRIIFPYLILIGLTAYSMAVLYVFRSFVTPAFSPCLFNIAVIVSAFVSPSFLAEPTYGLAAGVLAGGVLQLWVQIKPMKAAGMVWQWPKTLSHPGAVQVGQLLLPRMVGAGVYQLNLVVDTFCASLSHVVGAGGISAIYYANRVIQFPLGVFGFALISAVLPALSGLAAKKDMEQFKRTLIFSVENIFFILVPLSVLMVLLAEPVIRILFERGEFGRYSTDITSLALMFYAVGLFSFGGSKIVVTAFHALQDTRTPVKVAAVCLVINAVLNFLLMGPLKVGGIALASALSATVNFFWLFYLLNKKLGVMEWGFKSFLFKVAVASVVMGGVIEILQGVLDPLALPEIVELAVLGGAGLGAYGAACFLLKIEQVHKVLDVIRERLP